MQTLDKNQTVIVYCGLGGTLHVGTKPYKPGGKSFKGDPERQFGRESRSLKTCYELQEVGCKLRCHSFKVKTGGGERRAGYRMSFHGILPRHVCVVRRAGAWTIEDCAHTCSDANACCTCNCVCCLCKLAQMKWTSCCLCQAGFKNVLHLEGGISQWRHDGRAVEP